ISYFILTFYDRLGTIYAGHKVSYGRVAFASFCAYSLSHNLGFAAVSGAAVRYRLYAHWGLTPFEIGKTVAFCSLTFALGGLVLGGFILFLEPHSIPFFGQHVPLPALYTVGAVLWALVIAYVSLSRFIGPFRVLGHDVALPGWRMALLQVALATVDVATTATIFYALLPHAPGLTWVIFLGVYVSSYTAGLAANLPGGIGVFDTAMLFGLSPYLEAPQIVGAIVIFRLFYYIIPLFLAGAMFAGNEIVLRGGGLLRHVAKLSGPQAIGRWSEPDFAVTAATGAVGLCGALLLFLGVLAPVPVADFAWLDAEYAEIVVRAGAFVPSLIGAGLVVMAIGLSHRVNLAWGLATLLLIAGAAFTATQDDLLWVSAVLILTVMLVAPFRGHFYRHASLLSGPLEPSSAVSLIVLAFSLIGLATTRPHMRSITNDAWWAIAMSHTVPHSVRFTVATAVILAGIAIWWLVRPGRVRFLPWDDTTRRRLIAIGGASGYDAAAVPADGVVMGEAQKAAIPFRRVGPVLLGLGDPVGQDADRVSAVWRFRDLARQEGLDPAFWRTGSGLLKVYGDIGLTALALGPDGSPIVSAGGATDEDPSPMYLVCMAERDLTALIPLLPRLVEANAAS
ncbi:MAG: phosphatidylglycerol lysyltransferase domain-containing protein, partial [Rhodospirillales bacterium]